MSMWWKTLAALLIVLPIGGYVFGVMTAAPDQPSPQEPIRITQVSDDPSKTPTKSEGPTTRPKPSKSEPPRTNGNSGPGDDDGDDVEEIEPDIDDHDDHDDQSDDDGNDDGDDGDGDDDRDDDRDDD